MYVRIDSREAETISAINKQALEQFRQGNLSHWFETEKYVDHIFCAGSIAALEDVIEPLSRSGIHTHGIREEHIVDEIGIAHVVFEMQGEDKLVLKESVITNRIVAIFDLIENTHVDYIGWKCSDSTGLSDSSTILPDTFTDL